MFVFLHHRLESGNKNTPRDYSCSELVEHLCIDVFVANGSFTRLFDITFVERKGPCVGLGFGDRGLLVFLAALGFLVKNLLVQRERRGLGDVVCAEGLAAFCFFLHFTLEFVLFKSLLSNRLLVLMLQEARRFWDRQVVLALAAIWNEVLLTNKLFLQLLHQPKLLVFRILVRQSLGFCINLLTAAKNGAKDDLLSVSQFPALCKGLKEAFPRNMILRMLFVQSEQQVVQCFALAINRLTDIVCLQYWFKKLIDAEIVEESLFVNKL